MGIQGTPKRKFSHVFRLGIIINGIKTVVIYSPLHEGNRLLINQSDFNSETMILFEEFKEKSEQELKQESKKTFKKRGIKSD